MKTTTLQYAKAGDKVNLEFDILAKYLDAQQKTENKTAKAESKITLDYLRQKGFIV
jgi:riboflavin synthase alpha subunit